jgi:hypothetical protein
VQGAKTVSMSAESAAAEKRKRDPRDGGDIRAHLHPHGAAHGAFEKLVLVGISLVPGWGVLVIASCVCFIFLPAPAPAPAPGSRPALRRRSRFLFW